MPGTRPSELGWTSVKERPSRIYHGGTRAEGLESNRGGLGKQAEPHIANSVHSCWIALEAVPSGAGRCRECAESGRKATERHANAGVRDRRRKVGAGAAVAVEGGLDGTLGPLLAIGRDE